MGLGDIRKKTYDYLEKLGVDIENPAVHDKIKDFFLEYGRQQEKVSYEKLKPVVDAMQRQIGSLVKACAPEVVKAPSGGPVKVPGTAEQANPFMESINKAMVKEPSVTKPKPGVLPHPADCGCDLERPMTPGEKEIAADLDEFFKDEPLEAPVVTAFTIPKDFKPKPSLRDRPKKF